MNRKLVMNSLAIVIVCIFLFPLLWMLSTSFKSEVEVFQSPPTFIPHNFHIQAYTKMFQQDGNGILTGFRNSIVISLSSMFLATLLAIPAAYGIARKRMQLAHVFVLLMLVSQMLPATVLLTPLFIMFSKLKMINSLVSPILANATFGIPFSVLNLRAYFLSIPHEMEEAATIDGCSPLETFIKIIIPVSRTGIIVAAVFSFLFAWGDLVFGLTFINKSQLRPVTASIYNFMQQYGTSWNSVMAFGLLTILPVLLIFIFLQKYIVSGLVQGAVKG